MRYLQTKFTFLEISILVAFFYILTLLMLKWQSDEGINTDHSPGILHFHFSTYRSNSYICVDFLWSHQRRSSFSATGFSRFRIQFVFPNCEAPLSYLQSRFCWQCDPIEPVHIEPAHIEPAQCSHWRHLFDFSPRCVSNWACSHWRHEDLALK